jgi:hypothetical protein
VRPPPLQAFPFPSTLGEVALHPPSLLACLFTVHVGSVPSPPLQWSFPHTATFTSFPAPRLLGGCATPAFSGQLVYLLSREGLPLTPLVLGGPRPLCYVSFFVVVYYSVWVFSLFSLGGGQSIQGAMLIWPRVVCGSTMCRLAHLVVHFSQASRSCHLAAREPSWFLHLTWSGDAMRGLGVWRSRSFASSWWCFLQSVSLASLQDFTLGSTLSASSL